jgi:hypothetical protein
MNTGTKLVAFAAVVAAIFGGAMVVGVAVGPIDTADSSSHSAHAPSDTGLTDRPRGLAVAEAGFRLAVETETVAPDAASTFAFQIVDGKGAPVTAFDELHERRLHLIVLSRNLVDYLHLHPTMDADGRWTVELPALHAGSYRVFADFQPTGGDNLTLGTDVTVPGVVATAELPQPSTSSTVDDYTVSLSGTPRVGATELGFTVEVDGHQVRTDPYLGAAGHLVAIRDGDLAYLHVHPHDDSTSIITFTGEFPTAGTYRLFLDFLHNGTVRTAAFTVIVPDVSHDSMTDDSTAPDPAHDQAGH